MKIVKSSIPFGFQYRDKDGNLIVNWYPKKGTVYVQKNRSDSQFPEISFNEHDLLAILEKAEIARSERPSNGIAVDAGTRGNPGPCEYQISDLNGLQLEHKELGIHSNNYAELMGICSAISYAINHKHETIWTDSQVALTWIRKGMVSNTTSEKELLMSILKEINDKLLQYPIMLKHWQSDIWGEIPADFGRKRPRKK